jgi:hypothetical protein
MQKTLSAVLLLLVLVLSAALVRVQSREHLPEERRATAERVRPPRPAAPATPEDVSIAPAPRTVEVPEPVAKTSTLPIPIEPVKAAPKQPLTMTFTRSTKVLTHELNLREDQKKAIAEIRKTAEAAGLLYRERLRVIEEEAERAIRRWLDPQQLQAYDAAKAAPSDIQVVLSTPEEPALPEGRRPGFLGIVGSDAEGGGVQVTQVQQGTVAGYSGLRVGDVILEVNGEKVANYADLATKMRLNGEGGPVTLRIRRGATEFYQGAQLGPRPP